MAYYAYKQVRDLLPEPYTSSLFKERTGQAFEGTADYDGDYYIAAALYIEDLLEEIKNLKEKINVA